MNVKETAVRFTGGELRKVFEKTPEEKLSDATEIRVRLGKPLIIKTPSREFFIGKDGIPGVNANDAYKPCERDIAVTVELLGNYSLYAFQEEIKNGYITIAGGHRVGIVGRCTVEGGYVKTFRNISGLCFRITRQITGCSDAVIRYIKSPKVMHTMIISPPGCGKTTLLRDIIRSLSDSGVNVGVVDERSEIAGCHNGKAQNDVGVRTDVLDGCPKAEGMLMLLRSMSPEVIAVDEIGRREDIIAIEDVINAGIKLICTVHGAETADLLKRPVLAELIEKNIFERFIVLKYGEKPGEIRDIYDGSFKSVLGGRNGDL